MKIICINKEHDELEEMKESISKIKYCSISGTFLFEKQAIDFLSENYCDLVIYSIEDIDSAKESISKLKEGKNPFLMVVVITKDSENAVSAYKLGADGYLLKPVKEVELYLLLDKLVKTKQTKKPVNVLLSGNFSLNMNGKQVFIDKPKLEEFLVYLIYQNRNLVKMDDVILAIDKSNISDLKERYIYRQLCFELKQLCIENEMEEIFTYNDDSCYFNCNYISCDYYDRIEEELEDFNYKYLYHYKWVEKVVEKPPVIEDEDDEIEEEEIVEEPAKEDEAEYIKEDPSIDGTNTNQDIILENDDKEIEENNDAQEKNE